LGASGSGYSYLPEGGWQASVAYRWLHSDRHFIDDSEQEERQDEGTEVVNDVHTWDVTATYGVTKRVSLSLTLPFVSATRSSLYEHDRTNRYSTFAAGLGDIRLMGNVWLLSPDEHPNGNIALGVGMKFPTGDYKVADIRHRATGEQLAYVDNSIQPGDGGFGVLVDLLAFQKLRDRTFGYVSATYLFNPQNTNSIGNSIWDSYIGRIGVAYAIWPEQGLSLSLGGRMEGVTPKDAFGKTEGRRRPGYAMSIEPGITWSHRKVSINLTAPVALYRYRQNYRNNPGDAAFADYLITSSITYRF
jgi:hypothetical protein